ncbi:MAG: hypothetical protein KDB82_01005 [Planctomycetes bacterium]|nr:hypothetical protein [Planctomycetota bacterium]
MRTPHWLGIVLLALVLGATVGYVLSPTFGTGAGRDSRAESGELPEPESEEPLPSSDVVPGNDVDAPVSHFTDEPVDEAPGSEPSGDDSLVRAIKAIPLDAIAEGTGVFRGHVRDPDGNPVAGVRVTASPFSHWYAEPKAEGDSLDDEEYWEYLAEVTRRIVRQRAGQVKATREAITDEKGFYEIRKLPDERFLLNALHDDYEIQPAGRRHLQPDAVVDWVASRAGWVEVTVSAPEDIKTDDVSVYFEAEAAGVRSRKVKPGVPERIKVGVGTWQFRASAGGEKWKSKQTTVTVRAGEDARVSIELKTPPMILAGIEYADGRPAGGVAVRYAVARDELSPQDTLDPRRQLTTPMTPDVSGDRYQSDELEPGDYVVGLFLGNELRTWDRVTVSDTGATINFKLQAPGLADGIRVFLHLPDGFNADYPNFLVRIDEHSQLRVDQWRLDDASYLLVPSSIPEVENVSPRITLTLQKLGTQSAKTTGLKGVAVDLRFEKPAELTLILKNVPNGTERDLGIRYVLPDGSSSWTTGGARGHRLKAEDGVVSLPWGVLQPGEYEFSVFLTTRGSTGRTLAAQTFRMESGKDLTVELELADVYQVTIQAKGIDVYTWMNLGWDGQKPAERCNVHMDEDGKCILTNIPAGTYTLKYRLNAGQSGEKTKTFTINGDKTVYLTE